MVESRLFHFLYIDSNLESRVEVLKTFNPPQNMEFKLFNKSNSIQKIHDNYDLLFTTCETCRQGLSLLLDHNYDQLVRETHKLIPFDSIIFEVKTGATREKYQWQQLLQDISQIGFLELGLKEGLLSFGSRFSESTKDVLMRYNVKKAIRRPFIMSQLKEELLDYLTLISGSSYVLIEEMIESDEIENKDYINRSLRMLTEEGNRRSITLTKIVRNKKEFTSKFIRFFENTNIQEPLDQIDISEKPHK